MLVRTEKDLAKVVKVTGIRILIPKVRVSTVVHIVEDPLDVGIADILVTDVRLAHYGTLDSLTNPAGTGANRTGANGMGQIISEEVQTKILVVKETVKGTGD